MAATSIERTTPPMKTWIITYNDGEKIRTETIYGKLSLDPTWAFIMDTQRSPSTIILAVPAHRVIDVKEDPSPEGF